MSSLSETSHIKGTPVYCAPEMLINPYLDVVTDKVAKASRKTDMYAFAILAWEVLTQESPLHDIKSEAVLGAKIHQGLRPSIESIPSNCPTKVIKMILSCWDDDRSVRKSAVEVYSILQYQYGLIENSSYDIFISYEPASPRHLISCLFHRMTQYGYKVYYNDDSSNDKLAKSSSTNPLGDSNVTERQNISLLYSCKALIACIDENYQQDDSIIQDVREVRKMNPPRPAIPIFISPNHEIWSNQELIYLFQLRAASSITYDFSHHQTFLAEQPSDSEPTSDILINLHRDIDVLVKYLISIDCNPSESGDAIIPGNLNRVFSSRMKINVDSLNSSSSPNSARGALFSSPNSARGQLFSSPNSARAPLFSSPNSARAPLFSSPSSARDPLPSSVRIDENDDTHGSD
jgi:hypothetical protein